MTEQEVGVMAGRDRKPSNVGGVQKLGKKGKKKGKNKVQKRSFHLNPQILFLKDFQNISTLLPYPNTPKIALGLF